jgi:hypothetical protein
MMNEPWPPDPLLDEVDEARRLIMAEHGNDYRKVLAFYMDAEKEPLGEDGSLADAAPARQDQSAA